MSISSTLNDHIADVSRVDSNLMVIEEEDGDEDSDLMSRGQLTQNTTNLLIGIGMLGLPYALRASGGLLGVSIVLVVSLLMAFTGTLVGKSLLLATPQFEKDRIPNGNRDFAALAKIAFGNAGKVAIGLSFMFELWFAMEAFVVLVGIHLNILTGLSKAIGITISMVLSILLLFVSNEVLSYMSMASIFAICLSVIALLVSGLDLPAGSAPPRAEVRLAGAFTALGQSMFSFAGHPCLPSLYWASQNPQKDFMPALGISFVLAGVFYSSVSVIGYYFYGDLVSQVFTENLGKTLSGATEHPRQSMAALSWACSACFLIKMQGTLPIIIAPVTAVLEEYVFKGAPGKTARVAFLAVFASVSWVVAIFFSDEVSTLVAFCGCLLAMITSVIFPCVAYLKISNKPLREYRGLEVGAVLAAMFGVVFAIAGTYINLTAAVAGKHSAHGHAGAASNATSTT